MAWIAARQGGATGMTTQILDPIPAWTVFLLFAIVALLCYEAGFRVGRWWQDRVPGEQEGPTDVLVGALLALMAFLLAVTMTMASDRFDTRRGMVLAEANAIGQAYLQSDYLPEPSAEAMKELFREYLPLRIVPADRSQLPANIERSRDMHAQMWALFAEVVKTGHSPDLMSSLGGSLTDIVNLEETRVTAGLYARVPETVLWLLIIGSILSLAMVGYSAGVKGHRSIISAVVLVLALGIVIALVMDLDRPQDGLVNVSQQPLLDVQRWIGLPTEG
jgi:hypothetical protein